MKLKNVKNSWVYDEISSIEEIGDITTVDISVSGDNLFYGNDILTHNSGFGMANPDLASVSESVGLCATADAIVSIFQNEEDRELGIIRLGMMKNRYGMRGQTQAMRIDYATLTITQADDVDSFEDDTVRNLAAFTS